MKYSIDLPEPVVERLRRYANERQQTPEEEIATLIDRELRAAEGTHQRRVDGHQPEIPVGVNPLAEFFGRYTADVPGITIHHDAYMAE
ncbi:MAG TPA: hypothetical protein VJQ45_04520 [Ktedonobacterales bacterium]|nr:hypothetical protein [Ktedonobacterales bacterium]